MLVDFKKFSGPKDPEIHIVEPEGQRINRDIDWAQAVAILGIDPKGEYTGDIDAPGIKLIIVIEHGQPGHATSFLKSDFYIFNGDDLWLPIIDLNQGKCTHTVLTTEHQELFKLAVNVYLSSDEIHMATMSDDGNTKNPFRICPCSLSYTQ